MLLIDNKPLPQSGAIVRYLARELNLLPENSLLTAYTDMIVETVTGLFDKLPLMEKDEAKKVIFQMLSSIDFNSFSFVFTDPNKH